MTTRESEDRAREIGETVRRCKAFRWRPGMLTLDGARVTRAFGRDASGVLEPAYHEVAIAPDDAPDLRDPATLGCLLALVRELHREPLAVAVAYVHHEYQSSRIAWSIEADGAPLGEGGAHDSEAAALVASLEAATARRKTAMLTITAADALAALEEAGGGE